MTRLAPIVTILTALLAPSVALAEPPPNDARTAPEALTLPASVDGTTVEATTEPGEGLAGTVWYEFVARDTDAVSLRLVAAGDLDASVQVFRRVRSQLTPITQEPTDENGVAALRFEPVRGATYLVLVGQRGGSVAGSFRLDVFAPQPLEAAPGPALPEGGASRVVDALQNAADRFAVSLRAGVSYRIRIAAEGEACPLLRLFPPGETVTPRRVARCNAYLLFTPRAGEGGRYSLRVDAQPRRRGPQRYRLQVARAGADDTAPGLFLANYETERGSLRGIDAVDLYRFDVARRSDVRLALRTSAAFRLELRNDRGRRIAVGRAELVRQLAPGRYFAAVLAAGGAGRYRLQRVTRTITRTSVALPERIRPGQAADVRVRVRPAVDGPVMVTIDRFDPLSGYQFFRRAHVTASGGVARLAFTPPTVGRWRATASFEGTRTAAPSEAGYARVLVAAPLRPD